jgi:hypothetical protein
MPKPCENMTHCGLAETDILSSARDMASTQQRIERWQ